MPTEAQETTTPTSAESSQGSYVQSILGTAGEFGLDETPSQAAQPQPQADTDSGTAPDQQESVQSGETTSTTGDKPELETLIQQFAKEHGLNPQDPNQRKILKRLADKELYIQQLKAGKTAEEPTATPEDNAGPELLTAFEKELAAADGDEPTEGQPPKDGKPEPAAQTTGKQPDAADAAKYNDVGDEWKSPEDSLSALNEAWAENDLKKVHDIEMARLRRNFDQGIAPQLLRFVESMVEQRLKGFVERDLGDVVPEVRRTVTDRRVAESREFAIDELRKAGAAEINKLFEVEDGPPITFDGQQFPNTPLNRILAKHPEIMRVVETHPDPAKAERKTFISRYKLAYQIYKAQGSGGVTAATARKLVDAGRELKDRESTDRARQSINAGSGASGRGEKSPKSSYVAELNNLPGEVPFSSLL